MFRIIPGNSEFLINLNQEIRKRDGTLANLIINNNKVQIELYGKRDWFDLKWVSLIAHFEMFLPGDNIETLMLVDFYDMHMTMFKSPSSKMPVFRKPICVQKDDKVFRIIPPFPRYAVSKDGVVIEWSTLDQLKVAEHKENSINRFNSRYPLVYLHNPETTHYKYAMIHRLVATAWVRHPDNDFVNKPIVNHIDGNKQNYHFSNLEWCSFRENNVHAVNADLRADNLKCKVRDFETGIVREFNSLCQAEQFMGIGNKHLRTNTLKIRKGELFNDRYEFKLASDETPWFYENRKEKVKPGRYIITVTHEDGSQEEFFDTRDLISRFALWNCQGAEKLLKMASTRFPFKKFELFDQYNARKLQAYHLESKNIIETDTMADMCRATNISEPKLKSCLRYGESFVENGYAYRYKSESPWCNDFKPRPEKKFTRFKASHAESGKEYTFNSMREAAKILKLDRRSMRNCFINQVKLKGWSFSEV